MNIKRELHTLHIKYDSEFKTLSKIALSQLLLKIIFLKQNGALFKQIKFELNNVILGDIENKSIEEAIEKLKKEKKIRVSGGRHFIHESFLKELQQAEKQNELLHNTILEKYFGRAESSREAIKTWFQDTTIKFFETFSFEWFYQITYRGKKISGAIPNLREVLTSILDNANDIVEQDKTWLKQQYNHFIDSDDANDNLLFWQYGISMFSSRLITARTYADEISIEMFKDSKFILDTNILMILDLEGHELNDSLKALEIVLKALNITPIYFANTREEYLRAMSWRKQQTINVFNNYTLDVLKVSDCPFIQTALKRHCENEEHLNIMFDQLMDIPDHFHKILPLSKHEFAELNDAIDSGESDDNLKDSLNEVFKRRFKKNKREKPLTHDAGLIKGTKFLQKNEKCWIVTSDSTLKLYAIENSIRDENEIAIGLDVIIGVLAINSGGINVEASNFAPLFKNLIKYALIPESTAFEVQDLAFILNSNTKVNELSDDRVIEIAKNVKRKRVAGEEEENISLYLRREIEGEKIGLSKDIAQVKERERITFVQKEKAELERDIAFKEIRERRRGELRDKYDRQLLTNKVLLIAIPIFISVLIFLTLKYGLKSKNELMQYLISSSVELIFGIVPLIPLNKRLIKKHSEYVQGIDKLIEKEIDEIRRAAKIQNA